MSICLEWASNVGYSAVGMDTPTRKRDVRTSDDGGGGERQPHGSWYLQAIWATVDGLSDQGPGRRNRKVSFR